MKVTIRGVNPKLWEQAKHDCITDDKTLGQIVNEGLVLRQQAKGGKAEAKEVKA